MTLVQQVADLLAKSSAALRRGADPEIVALTLDEASRVLLGTSSNERVAMVCDVARLSGRL